MIWLLVYLTTARPLFRLTAVMAALVVAVGVASGVAAVAVESARVLGGRPGETVIGMGVAGLASVLAARQWRSVRRVGRPPQVAALAAARPTRPHDLVRENIELDAALAGLVWYLGAHDVCTPEQLAGAAAELDPGARLRLGQTIEALKARTFNPQAALWLSLFLIDLGKRSRPGG